MAERRGLSLPCSLLLVDDEPAFLDLLRLLLDDDPRFTILGEAASGEEAVTMLAKLHPEAVLVDIQMRGISGFETTKRLLALSPELRVVIVSGFDDPEYKKLAHEMGAVGFLNKGKITADTLIELLQRS